MTKISRSSTASDRPIHIKEKQSKIKVTIGKPAISKELYIMIKETRNQSPAVAATPKTWYSKAI